MERKESSQHPSFLKRAAPFLKIIISISVLVFVLEKVGLKDVLKVMGTMNLGYFFLVSVFFLIVIFLGSIRWRLFLSVSGRIKGLSITRIFLLNLMGSFFNFTLPGMVGGDAVRGYYFYKEIRSVTLSLGSLFVDRYIGLMTLIILGLIALPFGMSRIKGTGAEWAVPLIAFIFVAASLFFFFLRAGRRFKSLSHVYEYFEKLWNAPHVLLKTFLLSVLMHALAITMTYLISLGIGARVSLLDFFLFMPIINTITAVPVSISGLGIREGAFVILFGFIGIAPDVATSISLVWYFSCVVSTIPGIFVYIRWRSRAAEEECSIPAG